MKKEKETLAHHYETEEECLTNDLSRKLDQLRQEKCKLEQTLEQEQECLVNKLMRKIEKLEAETSAKQSNLEQLRREMVELENTLEQEQEALVNKLWKRMDKLETEKRSLQIKLDEPVSEPVSVTFKDINNGDTATNLSSHIQHLRSEVLRLRSNLMAAQKETNQKMQQFAQEEKTIREENVRLQQKLQAEVERRERLCRHLSESESSLEMDEERFYNENFNMSNHRQRTISSPVPNSPSSSRPLSPGAAASGRCYACGQCLVSYPNVKLPIWHFNLNFAFILVFFSLINVLQGRRTSERFIKPAVPTTSMCLNTSAPNVMSSISSGSSSTPLNIGSHHHNVTLPANISNSSMTFGSNNALTQPSSPMDTSAYTRD